MNRSRDGVALLEAIIALAILGTMGSALLAMTGGALRASGQVSAADATTQQAGALLDAVTLWSRSELDQRLGERPQGPFKMQLVRVAPALYAVALRDTLTDEVLLATTLYRPEARDGSR